MSDVPNTPKKRPTKTELPSFSSRGKFMRRLAQNKPKRSPDKTLNPNGDERTYLTRRQLQSRYFQLKAAYANCSKEKHSQDIWNFFEFISK